MTVSDGTSRPATISDVALAAQVSRTTISRYLSRQYDSMSPETRARIETAIATLHYRPSRLARGLRQDKSFTIGFVMPDITNPYSTRVLRAAEALAESRGYMVVVCDSDRDPEKERRYFDILKSYGIDGLLVSSTGHNDEAMLQLASSFPIVLVDQEVPGIELDLVSSDNASAIDVAINHLLDRGFNDIGFVTDVIGHAASRAERVDAFRARLEALPTTASRVYEADVREGKEIDAALDGFLSHPRGDSRVLFAGNGVMLLKIYSGLKERGVSIPDDVALIGFDDDEWSASAEPSLTTIAQSTQEIGSRAAQLLLDRIGGVAGPVMPVKLNTELKIRRSTSASIGRSAAS